MHPVPLLFWDHSMEVTYSLISLSLFKSGRESKHQLLCRAEVTTHAVAIFVSLRWKVSVVTLEGGVSSSAQKGNGLKMAAGSSADEHGKMILKGRWYRLEDSAWEATCYQHLLWVWPVETANSSTICTSAGWVFFIQIKATLVYRCYILLLEFSWVPFGSPSTNIVHLCWKYWVL